MKPIGGKIKLVDCEGCPLRVSKELIENSLGKVVFDIKKQHFKTITLANAKLKLETV